MIPYGKQTIDSEDIQSVVDVLQSEYLTTGPKVAEFEQAVCEYTGAKFAVAVSNGTSALHSLMYAVGVGRGDEVIVPAITFSATANCVVYQGGTPVFADISPDTLLIDPLSVMDKITDKTKAVIAVDYAGQPCAHIILKLVCDYHSITLLSDACHSLGGAALGIPVGQLAEATCFSFHPVKAITTGEGGMVVTDSESIAGKARMFRNHGREGLSMVDLGYNYRMTDFQCALGISQLKKLDGFVKRRNQIADLYDRNIKKAKPLKKSSGIRHAYHLYVIRTDDRDSLRAKLLAEGIGTQIHYEPVYLNPYYQKTFGYGRGMCPNAETAYEQILSLPIYPFLTDEQVLKVCEVINS